MGPLASWCPKGKNCLTSWTVFHGTECFCNHLDKILTCWSTDVSKGEMFKFIKATSAPCSECQLAFVELPVTSAVAPPGPRGLWKVYMKVWLPIPPQPTWTSPSTCNTDLSEDPWVTCTHPWLGQHGDHGRPMRSFICAGTPPPGPLGMENAQDQLCWDTLRPGSLDIGRGKSLNAMQFSSQLTLHDLGEKPSRQRGKWIQKPKIKELTLSFPHPITDMDSCTSLFYT